MSLDRRKFLSTASLAAAGFAVTPAGAIEPVVRNGAAKFKFSLAAYSYRNLLTGDHPELTLFDFVDDCARFGLEGVEPTSYYFPTNVDDHYLHALAARCFLLGLDVSGTAIGNDFCHPPGDKRDAEIAGAKAWIDRAAVLGAPVIRIFSGAAKSGQSLEDARALAIAGMEECCEYAGERGVYLALENHGGLTAQPEGMLELVHAVQSPWFGVNLDTGNFHGEDVYADLARLAPYAVNVQVKVVVRGADGEERPSDFSRLAEILRDVRYRGYVVLEYEEREDPREACPRYLDALRDAFAG